MLICVCAHVQDTLVIAKKERVNANVVKSKNGLKYLYFSFAK